MNTIFDMFPLNVSGTIFVGPLINFLGFLSALVLALVFLKIASEALWAAGNAASVCRYFWVSGRTHGMAVYPALLKLPKEFLYQWRQMYGFRPGSTRIYSDRGEWRGIGRWVVYRKSLEDACVGHDEQRCKH